jgi:hypothetical protein
MVTLLRRYDLTHQVPTKGGNTMIRKTLIAALSMLSLLLRSLVSGLPC